MATKRKFRNSYRKNWIIYKPNLDNSKTNSSNVPKKHLKAKYKELINYFK